MVKKRPHKAKEPHPLYRWVLELFRRSGRRLPDGDPVPNTETLQRPGSALSGGTQAVSLAGPRTWPIVLALLVPAVLFLALQPATRLKPDPPPEFVPAQLPAKIDQPAWAHEYWNCARNLQPRYAHAMPLPQLPPPEFRITQEETLPRETAEGIRLAYWEQFQKVWLTPAAWETTYTLRPEWVSLATDMLRDLQSGVAKAGRASVP